MVGFVVSYSGKIIKFEITYTSNKMTNIIPFGAEVLVELYVVSTKRKLTLL